MIKSYFRQNHLLGKVQDNRMKKTTLLIGFIFLTHLFLLSACTSITPKKLIAVKTEKKKPSSIRSIKVKQKKSATTKNTWIDPVTKMNFIWVEGGRFQMGKKNAAIRDEQSVDRVKLDGFWMAKYEVTQAQWKQIMGSNPSEFSTCGNTCPVENISWNDAQDFIAKLNRQGQNKFRLPTEAEWEYACRERGKNQTYCGGNSINSLGWYKNNSSKKTHWVGLKTPNSLGLYDMSGNVSEWVSDWYSADYYKKSSRKNPNGSSSGHYRVFRGGSWFNKKDMLRARNRAGNEPAFDDFMGRMVLGWLNVINNNGST